MTPSHRKPKEREKEIKMEETSMLKNKGVHEEDEQFQEAKASKDIWKYLFGFVDMAVFKCAVELKIPEAIETHKTQPVTLTDLSSILSCKPQLLHRIMRFLVHQGIFKEQTAENGLTGYANTPLSRLMIRGLEKSRVEMFLMQASQVMLMPFLKLSNWVSGSETPPFDAVHGKDLWAYIAENHEHGKLFDEAMACDARLLVPAVVEGCGDVFEGVLSLVNVGGGNGTALGELVKAFPWLKGINFDLPNVVNVAKSFDGVEDVGGDMFVSIPKCDAVLLKWILHDWADEECIEILKNCREAIPEKTGKVIILDVVVGEYNGDGLEYARMMVDMIVMAHTSTGKERTLKEFDYILKQSGFSRFDVRPIKALQSVIVAYP